MESAEELKIVKIEKAERKKAIQHWLQAACGMQKPVLQPMPGDASQRRYFRVNSGVNSFVLMDAPPPVEQVHTYIALSRALRHMGLRVPEVLAEDKESGFLLLTDFGDATYLNVLNSSNAGRLYQQAMDALIVLQGCRQVEGYTVPYFTANFMWKEWAWHKEWFLQKLLGLSSPFAEAGLDKCYHLLVECAVLQPQVLMHRDYHSANLMLLPDGETGILDFQDAFIGPVTYDLASLLRDSYIGWTRDRVQEWVCYYARKLHDANVLRQVSDKTFLYWFDLMSMQRNLKALLTFARKQVRDHQPYYLEHVPRTLNYLLQTSQRYAEFSLLHDYLRVTVQPAFTRMIK